MDNLETIGIYIHIPFCIKKCPYCDFTSFVYSADEEERYLNYLLKEIKLKAHGEEVDTVYLGGGTPSLLSDKSLFELFDYLHKNFNLRKEAEISIEVNPGTVTKRKAKKWKDLGINRVSIGAQSFLDTELMILGRIHSVSDIYQTFYILRNVGFNNINLDIMYSLPFQKKEDFYLSLKKTVALSPEHISIYNLTIEEGTPFYEDYNKGRLIFPDNDSEAEMFLYAMDYLENNGFLQYEISNFAKNESFKCKHNLKYWNQKKYYGFGVSAFSFDPPIRYGNYKNLCVYYEKIKEGSLPIEEIESLSSEELAKDYLFLKLRLKEGFDENEFKEKFNIEVEDFIRNFQWFVENGLLERKEKRIYLTKKGILLANEVFQDIL